MTHDFTIDNNGTVWLLRPNTKAALQWMRQNGAVYPTWKACLIVEHRNIRHVVRDIEDEGLTIDGADL